jgi:hypothetical protein
MFNSESFSMNKEALSKPYIQLICHPYEDSCAVNTRVTIDVLDKDATRDDLVQVFQEFMTAVGYGFNNEQLVIEPLD